MPMLIGNLLDEIKLLPKCRAMQNGIVYRGRIVPEEAILMIGFVPSARMVPYPARTLFFVLTEQKETDAYDSLKLAIDDALHGAPDRREGTEFIVSIVPSVDLLW